ncbi:peptidoglycan DD-metalloendopeptidase family protein [candidate division KSB3 bacterium]|uniref:Peptidoglycan DD-metalloendopeptidase family protein n=1 Tax=candidate division KSB3 bacterium TaxID=2044937 RepID=A0A9D5Q676_9BACT|nr:peptidoglycan DD-metalloendopeptidase family protein [candidate division KSB3 bacterium]MBD3324987.1 peptidoglycan DD-metalloendopeptidase family protein [candidate division KSB3 bacterium]
MTDMATELPDIRKQSRDQRMLIERYEEDITELRQMVSRLKLVNAKLMLMAGVENPAEVPINFGMGGVEEPEDFSEMVSDLQQESQEIMLQKIENLSKLKDLAENQEELSQRLMEYFQDQQTLLASTPSIWPVHGWVTSGFGMRKSPFTGHRTMHAGLDIATKSGTDIKAPADGIVSYAGNKGAFGKVVVIDHGYGYATFYGHCSGFNVEVGDRVKRGDIIAYVGNSGKSTGPHLHYEVRVNGVATNPTKFILDL